MSDKSPLLVVMGVSGSGKTKFGAALAERLRLRFAEGDDFHPPENIAKMSAGEPLDDADRRPWLDAIGRWLAEQQDGAVVSCSALRRTYRDRLRRQASGVRFVHLAGHPDVIAHRQAGRTGHYMPPSLLASQFATLEPLAPDEDGIVLDVEHGVEALVEECVAILAADHAPD